MSSSAGRHVMRWNTNNRVYLKARVAYWFSLGTRGNALVKKMDELIPRWREEFVNEPDDIDLDNALMQRADKAHRNDEFPRDHNGKTIWKQALADEASGNRSYGFEDNLPERPKESAVKNRKESINDVIERIRNIGNSRDITFECKLMLDNWIVTPLYTDPGSFVKMSSDKVREFLYTTSRGRRMPFGNDQPSRMAGMIADAYLRAHNC
jgi:hypothetical protein